MNTNKIIHSLKVLYIAPDALSGGSSRSLLQLILYLRESFHIQPIVIVPKIKSKSLKIEEKFKEYGIPCYSFYFYWYKGEKGIKQYVKILLNWLILYPIILFELRNLTIDLVHTNSSVTDLGGVISRVKRVKHIWHLREFGDLDFNLFSGLGNKIDSLIYKMGNIFIAISQCVKNAFTKVIPEDKIKLIYNGIQPKAMDLDAKHINPILQFVQVGAIKATKNQLEALQAFSLLRKKGYIAQLHFIGSEDKMYRVILDQYIKEYSLSEYVKFWGECDNISEIISNMDVGLMLSKNEAFGRVTVEYMMQNLVVIASNTGANPEIVVDGESGYIYQLGDIEELANKMIFCINNRAEAFNVGALGKKRANLYFNSKNNAENIYKIYQILLNREN